MARHRRRRRFHFAQLREDRVEFAASLRERALRLQLAFARSFQFALQRSDAPFQIRNGGFERLAFVLHARHVFGGLRVLRFQRFAPRQRRGVIRFQAREFAAQPDALRAQFFEREFVSVNARASFR